MTARGLRYDASAVGPDDQDEREKRVERHERVPVCARGHPRGNAAVQTDLNVRWSAVPDSAKARGRTLHLARPLRVVAGLALVAATVALAIYLVFDLTGNLHVVVPGVCYRSAQLSPMRIEDVSRQLHLGSIINLRGDNTGTCWYDAEIAECTRLGIAHLDFSMSASKRLTPSRCAELIKIIENAPKPTLIHCKAGADRTGLAAALFLMSQGTSFDQAAQQLSLKYFHFPWLGSPSVAMDQTLNAYGEVTVPPPGGANIAE